MEIYPKRKSDAEYVEIVRRTIQRSKWVALVNAGMSVVFVTGFLLFWRLIFSVRQTFPEQAEAMGQGVQIGIMLGAFAGFILLLGLANAVFAVLPFTGQRTARLMLKFHDELKSREAFDHPELEKRVHDGENNAK